MWYNYSSSRQRIINMIDIIVSKVVKEYVLGRNEKIQE